MVKSFLTKALLVAASMSSASPSFSSDGESCGGQYWPGTLPEHSVDAIAPRELQEWLDHAPIIQGVKYSVTVKGKELWLDAVEFPGDVSALASIRAILIIGRIVKPGYDKLILADGEDGVFEISYADLHIIGCQFVWTEGKGQNPIALNRELADALRYYPDGGRVAPIFTGSLLGDTTAMLTTFNQVVYPKWLLKSVVIK